MAAALLRDLCAPAAAVEPLKALRVWPSADYTRMTIETRSAVDYEISVISEPGRVVVDLQNVDFDSLQERLAAKSFDHDPFIRGARVGRFKPGVTRLVLDLRANVRPQIFSLKPVGQYEHRLVLDIYPLNPPDPLTDLIRKESADATAAPAAAPAGAASGAAGGPSGAASGPSGAAGALSAATSGPSGGAGTPSGGAAAAGPAGAPAAPAAPGAAKPPAAAPSGSGELARLLGDLARTAADAARAPVDAVRGTMNAARAPADGARTAADAARAPPDTARAAVDAARPPADSARTPAELEMGPPVPESIRAQAARRNTVANAQGSGPAPPATATGPAPARTAPPAPVRPKGLPRTVTVVIDAGHGGEDPGARGRRGTYEKDVTLAIARKLKTVIDQQPQMRAVLTRDSDYFIPLAGRVDKARRARADLFVSIHADSFVRPNARGSSVFALSERGATSVAANWLAHDENRSDLIGGVNLETRDRRVAQTLLDLSQTAAISDSLTLGQQVLSELSAVNRLHKGSVEQAGFAVLKSPDVPSILVETAFISNPDEEKRLRDPGYQQRIAKAIVSGLKRYFARNPPLARQNIVASQSAR